MDVEQPQLGNVGVDALVITLGWTWERGWRARVTQRLSGSEVFLERALDGHDPAELHAILSDGLATALGLS